jgi:hypothetical protein
MSKSTTAHHASAIALPSPMLSLAGQDQCRNSVALCPSPARKGFPATATLTTQCKCITIWRVFKTVRDSDWSADHIAAHGLTLDEVREAILEHPYWAAPGREGTTLIYGRTYAGRYLLVVAIDEGEEAFIVTARDMTDAEKKTLRRKAR